MGELEVTWKRAIRIWWLIAWRTLVGTFVSFSIIGAAVAYIVYLIFAPSPGHPTAVSISRIFGLSIGFALSIFWAIVVVRMAFKKNYGDFRLVLVSVPKHDPISN
jgi:hypothetical protein